MSTDYPHLHESVRSTVAAMSDDMRIRRIRADRWIGYGRAEAALSAFETLLSFPKRTRMPNLLLCGATNNGKSMLLEKFARAHPQIGAGVTVTSHAVTSIPVLKIQMPSGPDERRFFGAILDALGVTRPASDGLSRRQELAMRLMHVTAVSMLIIDEVHNLLSGAKLQQRRLLNLLRWIGNEMQIPIIAAGTAEALHAIQSDDQLANRFEPIALPRWSYGEEYRELLRTLEALLPLRCPSNLANPAIAEKILSAAEGILGEVVSLVTRAAERAVRSGTETITLKVIDEVHFISPSQRRRVAV